MFLLSWIYQSPFFLKIVSELKFCFKVRDLLMSRLGEKSFPKKRRY